MPVPDASSVLHPANPELELGTWNLEPGTWNLEPGTWNLEPGTWNLFLEEWHEMLAVAHAESEVSLPQLPLEPDLFGRMLMEYARGYAREYYLRRDDNTLERDNSARYFRPGSICPPISAAC